MKNYLYNVNVYGENDEATFRTNDVRDALDSFLKAGAQGIHCDLVNGCTGEVLAIVNCPDCEDYATDETMLMIQGMIFEALEGEDTAPEVEEDDDLPGEPIFPGSGIHCIQCGQPTFDPLTELMDGLMKLALSVEAPTPSKE